MLLIDAIYINESGGKVLLELLVKRMLERKIDCHFLLDQRLEGKILDWQIEPHNTTFLKSSFYRRWKYYSKHKKLFSNILCFANVPPPIKCNSKVITYFHSYMLDLPKGTSFKQKMIIKIKKVIIKLLSKNTDNWCVQSSHMSQLLVQKLGIKRDLIFEFPFYKNLNFKSDVTRIQNSFLYLSNAYEHKNHNILLNAWEILFNNGFNYNLTLTVKERFVEVIERIKLLQKKGVNVVNIGWVDDVASLMSQFQYQVYPSLTESFGLGLVEAVDCGCEVIAPDLPYVNAVVKPLIKFDPFSSENLANTIKSILDKSLNAPIQSKVIIENKLNPFIDFISH